MAKQKVIGPYHVKHIGDMWEVVEMVGGIEIELRPRYTAASRQAAYGKALRLNRREAMEKQYTVIVDEICTLHGGRNYSYQNKNENFVRQESICEGCTSPSRQPAPSPDVQAARSARAHERPARPSKR